MTFEERCERFVRNSKNEHNKFRFVYRIIFLNKKLKEHEDEMNLFAIEKKERPKDHAKAKQLIQ